MPGANDVINNLNQHRDRKVAGLYALLNALGKGTLESYAKDKAPWTDRTGHARQGLHGGAYKDSNAVAIYIAHSKDYGVHLEKARSGKYAILRPTLKKHKQTIKQSVSRFWEG